MFFQSNVKYRIFLSVHGSMVQIVNMMRVKCKMPEDLPWGIFFFLFFLRKKKAVVCLYPNPIFINNSFIFYYISYLMF